MSLDGCRLATIAARVHELKRRIAEGEFAGEAGAQERRAEPVVRGRVPSIIEGSSLAAYLHDTDAQGREPALGKSGCIPESTPPVLAMLDAELAACVAEETRTSSLMRTARAIVAQFEELISEEGLRIWGNFSGSSDSVAKHARKMKKRFALAIARWPGGGGGARRIRAAPEDDDGAAAAAAAEGAPAALT
ncbi:MAG: hypothetical protein SGJ11_13635 [Phycisphaerae bacterium]|mgnify:CR=1 FL=1|nr:hypothetical protein [Phycisphaerae bacterium]